MVSSGFAAITEKDVIGKYKMVMDTNAMKAQERQMMDKMKSNFDSVRLELKPGKVVAMSAMGKSETGKWAIVNGKIVVTPNKKGSKSLSLVPKGDGKTLVAVMEPGEQARMKGAKLTFVRI